MEAAFGITLPREKGFDTMAALEAAERGEVDAAVIMGGNLWGATPDTEFASRAMGAIGCLGAGVPARAGEAASARKPSVFSNAFNFMV